MFQQLLQEDFRMLQVVSTGAYYPPVDTTWKILTTGASQLTAGPLCIVLKVGALLDLVYTGVCHDPGHLDQSGELALLSLYK